MTTTYDIDQQLYYYDSNDNSITAVTIKGVLYKPDEGVEQYYVIIGNTAQTVQPSQLYSDITKLSDLVVTRETTAFNARMDEVKANIATAVAAFTPQS